MLSRSYPSHGFVIDFDEAQRLFENVRQASEDEIKIVKKLGRMARFQQPEPNIKFLTQSRGKSK